MKIEQELHAGDALTVIEDQIYYHGTDDEILLSRKNFQMVVIRLVYGKYMAWNGDKPLSDITEFYYPCTNVKIKVAE